MFYLRLRLFYRPGILWLRLRSFINSGLGFSTVDEYSGVVLRRHTSVYRDFNHFDQMGVGGFRLHISSRPLEPGTVMVVEFESVTVAFADGRSAI